jgi:MoaA/NifB/PqqE/SkfB family radical SAM enzyme
MGVAKVFPAVPALLAAQADSLEVTDFSAGWSFHAAGRLAGEARDFLDAGAPGPGLRSLGGGHPAVALLRRLAGAPAVPLTPASALELGGFDTLFLELTGACNEHCVHCYAESGPQVAAALPRATCEAVLRDAAELGFRRVQLTGGDPLLCPFLPDLVAAAAALGIPACEIYTNGLLLREPLLDLLAPHRPLFAFSFYSHRPEVHDAVTRAAGSQRRTLAAVRRALERGLAVRVAVVVMEENAGDVGATVDLLESVGVTEIGVSGSRPVGRGRLYGGTWDGGRRSAGAAVHRGAEAPGRGSLCVTWDGRVVPCVFNRSDVLGRLPEERLAAVARRPRRPPPSALAGAELLARVRRSLQCVSCQATAYLLRLGAGS